MEYITNEDIEGALSQVYRQYLTGHLGMPQPLLKHIDSDIEVGISHYRLRRECWCKPGKGFLVRETAIA